MSMSPFASVPLNVSRLLLPEATTDLEPVDPRQHHVGHDRVDGDRPDPVERLLAARREVDGVPLLAQATEQQRRKPHLVLDHQHSHRPFSSASVPATHLDRTESTSR
jgi:hypothetical protein